MQNDTDGLCQDGGRFLMQLDQGGKFVDWATSDSRNKLIAHVHEKFGECLGARYRIVDTRGVIEPWFGKITLFPRFFSEP